MHMNCSTIITRVTAIIVIRLILSLYLLLMLVCQYVYHIYCAGLYVLCTAWTSDSLFSIFWFCSDCSFDLHIITADSRVNFYDLNEFHKQCGRESTHLLEYHIHIYFANIRSDTT